MYLYEENATTIQIDMDLKIFKLHISSQRILCENHFIVLHVRITYT